jgi:GMP synthase (glutamine-hydrolysing)
MIRVLFPGMNRDERPLAILRMGTPAPAFRRRFGDFADWIRARLPAGLAATTRVVDPDWGRLPAPAAFRGVIITGSHSMVATATAGERKAFRWIERVLAAEIPVLGLCYGHQMLGHVLGGEVGPRPGGPEIGVVPVTFAAGGDPLFGPCGRRQRVAVIHWQGIRRLPAGAAGLGRSAREPHHAVRFAPRVWGVQFHPEFGAAALAAYVRAHAAVLRGQGRDPAAAWRAARRWREASGVIARFAALAAGRTSRLGEKTL